MNRYHHQFGMLPPFTRSSLVAKNPIPHHLIAHIVVPNLSSYEIMNYVGENALNGVPFILSIDSFEKTKPRIVYFKNKLYVLNRAIFATPNWPTVIVGFDGLKGFDYRHASGAVSGMLCCKRMLEYITIQHGTIQKIDQNAIERAISDFITNQYRNELIQCIGYRKKALEKGYIPYTNEF